MFLPVGDQPNPRSTPWVTWLLIAVNVAVFLLVSLPLLQQPADPSDPLLGRFLEVLRDRGADIDRIREHLTAYDLFVFRWGFRPAEPSAASLFASLFLHGGWAHLIGNMVYLWIFGDNAEDRLGRLGYLFMYLGTGVAATLFFTLFAADSRVPMLGASGAISGVLGCYFLWFPRNQVKVFVFLFPFLMDFVLVPARLVLGLYLLVDNLLPFLIRGGRRHRGGSRRPHRWISCRARGCADLGRKKGGTLILPEGSRPKPGIIRYGERPHVVLRLRPAPVPASQRGREPDLPDHPGLFPEPLHLLRNVQVQGLPDPAGG